MNHLWYSPKWDIFRIAKMTDGFLFKDRVGIKHWCFKIKNHTFSMADFYLIGEFD